MTEHATHTPQLFSDEELVKLFLDSHDNAYFEKLYTRYVVKVYQKCLALIKDATHAEDITQDIFLKLYNKMGTFKESARFSTWLFTITYNHCMDEVRYPGKGLIKLHPDMSEFEDESDPLFPDEYVLNPLSLQKAMSRLRVDERTIINMRYLENKSIRDIAIVFEINESAAKMRLMRCRDRLREKYRETCDFN